MRLDKLDKTVAGKKAAPESNLKPWHFALFGLAVILVLWQVIGYVNKRRAETNVTHSEAQDVKKSFPPGSTLDRREREK